MYKQPLHHSDELNSNIYATGLHNNIGREMGTLNSCWSHNTPVCRFVAYSPQSTKLLNVTRENMWPQNTQPCEAAADYDSKLKNAWLRLT